MKFFRASLVVVSVKLYGIEFLMFITLIKEVLLLVKFFPRSVKEVINITSIL